MKNLRGRIFGIDGQKTGSHEGRFLAVSKKKSKPSWLGFEKLHQNDAGAICVVGKQRN